MATTPSPYTKRTVPAITADLAASARALVAWLAIEFGNVQRAIQIASVWSTPVVTLTDAASVTVDASASTAFQVTLAGNRTVAAPTNAVSGDRMTITVIQDGTGGRTLAWNAVFKQAWSNTGNTAGKRSTIGFVFDGTNWNQVAVQAPYV